jgi:hypothetical protein
LRQPGANNQPSSFGSMSPLGIFECSVLNNFISGTSFDHKIFTAVSFGPAQCVPLSTSSASHKGNLLRPESPHPNPPIPCKQRFEDLAASEDRETQESGHLAIPGAFPETSPPTSFVPHRRKFDEFAADGDVETQETRYLAIPGAFPDTTLHPTIPTELDSSFEQTFIYKFIQPVRTTYNFAVARMQWIGRCLRRQRGNQGPVAGQTGMAVRQTCRAAVAVAGRYKRRMVQLVGRRSTRTPNPDGQSTNSSNNRNVLAQGNQRIQPAGPSVQSSNDQNVLSHGNQSNEPGFVKNPVLNDTSTSSLGLAQFFAIQDILELDYDIEVDGVLLGSESNLRLEEDTNLKDLLEDNFNFNYGIDPGLQQIEDVTSAHIDDILPEYIVSNSPRAPVSKANARLGEGKSVEGSLNDNSSPNNGLNHGFEQTREIVPSLLDGITRVQISDRRRSNRQLEKEAAKQRAEAHERKKVEAAARAEKESRLVEAEHVGEEKNDEEAGHVAEENVDAEEARHVAEENVDAEEARHFTEETVDAESARHVAEEPVDAEAQWLKSMGRSALPRECNVLRPVGRDWEEKVKDAMTRPLNAKLATVSDGTTLFRRDFDTVLKEPYWLNDEVIAAYVQLSVDKALEQTGHARGKVPKIHAFNSFFYKNLSTKGPESIKRWADRANIGGKYLKHVDTVFIPVNPGNHWTLLVVSPSKHTIEYFDSLSGSRTPPTHNVYTDNVKKWLRQEIGAEYNDAEWTVRIRNDGPQQNNNFDCGVFAITTAKLISLGYDPVGAYDASVMPAQRTRVVAELMARDWVDSEDFPSLDVLSTTYCPYSDNSTTGF